MKHLKQVATFVCMILLFASCEQTELLTQEELSSSERKPTPTITTALNYFPMEIGNEWTYLERTQNNQTLAFSLPRTIVHKIVGQENLNGNDYYKFEKTIDGGGTSYFYRRMEGNDFIDETGQILFSQYNFIDVLHTTVAMPAFAIYIGDMDYKMQDPSTNVIVPAGNFKMVGATVSGRSRVVSELISYSVN